MNVGISIYAKLKIEKKMNDLDISRNTVKEISQKFQSLQSISNRLERFSMFYFFTIDQCEMRFLRTGQFKIRTIYEQKLMSANFVEWRRVVGPISDRLIDPQRTLTHRFTFEQTFRKTNAVHSMPPISDSVRRKIVAIPSAILEERVDDDAAGTRSVDGRVVSNDTVFRSRIRLVHREKKKKKTLKTALRIPFGYGKRTFKLKIIAESETFENRRTSADTPVLLLFRIPHTRMRFLVKIDTARG